VARVLLAATDALRSMSASRMETVVGVFGSIGATLDAHPAVGTRVVDEFFTRAAPTLRAHRGLLQGYADAIVATLDKEWPEWQRQEARCRERRAALVAFLRYARGAGLEDLVDIDTGALDRRLEP
jgi:hypothetical protein